MKHRFWFLAAAMMLLAGISPAADDFDPSDMRMLRNPDIHKDLIVFVHGGDLWTVSSGGGEAKRLTSHVGYEYQPKFSPDGKWIAFSGDYDGNNDVYVIPSSGGEPRRLTWHPLYDRVIDWEPDGKSIRFQSARTSMTMRDPQLWTVPLDGGVPTMINLPTGGLSDWSPDGRKLAYNRITREHRTWKRYKGGMAQNIWVHDFENDRTTAITNWEKEGDLWKGTENYPMWRGDKIFFNSDRNDKLQIWSYDTNTGKFEKVTKNKTYDVKTPSEGPDRIVYELGGWLWVLDPDSGKAERIKVRLNDDRFRTRVAWRKVADRITGASPGPDAKRAVFSARGDIFTVPAEKGAIRNLTMTPGVNEVGPNWSPDGKWVSYFSDRDGEYELYIRPGDGTGEARKLTKGSDTYYFGSMWSPDSEKIIVYDATRRMRWIEVESGKSHEVSQGIDRPGFDVSWSPDSRWIAYRESEENGFGSIFLFDTENGKITPVTSMFTDDGNPAFDPDGDYLYFTSARSFQPRFGNYTNEPRWTEQDGLYLVTLREDVEHPFPPESDEVEVKADDPDADADEADDDGEDADDADDADEEEDEGVEIDLENIGRRIVALDVEPGNYSGLEALSGKLFYGSRPSGADHASIKLFDMEEREEKTVLDNASGFDLTADGESLFSNANGSYGFVSAAADQQPSDKPLRPGEMQTRTDPRAEWKQMYLDAWRLEGDFFYDPGMHGVDWQAMYDRYEALVPYVTDRRDLDYVIGEMISELGAGHSYVRGSSESPRAKAVRIGLLGCDFAVDGDRYRIVDILTERDWNKDQRTPLYGPGIDVNEGDYLLAVDGVDLDTSMNPYSLFENTVDHQVVLTLAAEKKGETREITVRPIRSDIPLRYVKWVEGNRRRVTELSDGKIGYFHLPDTAFDGAREFAKGYYSQTRMEALIIDERYNGGGFIPAFMLNIMNEKFLNMWKPRYGQDWRTPGTAFNGPMAMISNEHAGSGGDALPFYFKQYEMGPVIGKRTWGGLIGYTTYVPLMDGGNVTFPEFGLFNLDGEWDVENHGVDPDIVVENLPEEVNAGRDPQLETAVDVLLQSLKDRKDLPESPRFPRDR